MGWTPPGGMDVPWWRVLKHCCPRGRRGLVSGKIAIAEADRA
jgi:hypothetical protein